MQSREKSKSIEVIGNIESDESTCHSNEWLKLSECGSESKTESQNDVLRLLSKKCDRFVAFVLHSNLKNWDNLRQNLSFKHQVVRKSYTPSISKFLFLSSCIFCCRHLPVSFLQEIFFRCYVDPGPVPGAVLLSEQTIKQENNLDQFVHIVAGSLYKITPNIPPNNREVSSLFC